MKGGKSSGRSTTTSPTPFLQNGYTDGASSSREQAAANTNNMNAKQSSMFSKSGGNKKSKRGGKSSGRSTTSSEGNTVPQFSSGVGAGPVNANTSSVQNNQTGTQTIADAAGDCWATNSCSGGNRGPAQHQVYPSAAKKAGGKRKPRTRRRKNRTKTKSKRRAYKKQTKKRGYKKKHNKRKTRSAGRRRR